MRIDGLRRVTWHLRLTVSVCEVPAGSQAHLFVRSHRTGLWYAQAPNTVVLGDTEHRWGFYDIAAVAVPNGFPRPWGTRPDLHTLGFVHTTPFTILRLGRNK